MTPLAWALATARVFSVLRAHPLLREAVGPWWWAVALGLGAVLAVPMATGASGGEELPWALAIVAELVLGSILGWLVALPAHAALGAVGVASATLRVPDRSLVALGVAWILACALTLGLHRPLLLALGGTVDSLPLGDPAGWLQRVGDLDTRLVQLAHAALVLALALATPVLLPAAAIDIAALAISRGSPAVGAATTSMAPVLRAAAALIALGASWAAYDASWGRALG